MNAFLTFLGENSWGIIPVIARESLFWVLLIATMVMGFIFLVKLLNREPKGREIPPGFENSYHYRDDYAKQIKRKKEGVTLKQYAVITALLLFFPAIRLIGMIVYADEVETSIEKMPAITIPLGQSVTRSQKDYTCSKERMGYVFTYQPVAGSFAKEAGGMLIDTTPPTKVFKTTWWGVSPHFKKIELSYICKP